MFFEKNFEEKKMKKMKKIEGKKYLGAPTPPEDESICLFAGLLANPDMPLSLLHDECANKHLDGERGSVQWYSF